MSACIIVIDRPQPEEREAVHELVKANADTWWHWFENTWLVTGNLTAVRWRDVLKPAAKPGPSAILIVQLADEGWAYFGPKAKERAKWLHEHVKRYP